jgi:hypothetical protein
VEQGATQISKFLRGLEDGSQEPFILEESAIVGANLSINNDWAP